MSFPGGAVDMIALAVLLTVSIQFFGSIALYFTTESLVKAEQNYIFLSLV